MKTEGLTLEMTAALEAKRFARQLLHGEIGERRFGSLMIAWLGTFAHHLPEPPAQPE